MPRTAGLSCTRHLVPRGAMGVLLKSKGPLSMASAAILGFNLDGRRRFKVKLTWSISLSHN